MEFIKSKDDKLKQKNENINSTKKLKEGLNTSNMSKDVGMNGIIDEIGNLMKKFANEVNITNNNTNQIVGKIYI